MKHRDSFAPAEFEHDTSLRAREQELPSLAKAGLHDFWVHIHCPTLTDIKDKKSLWPTGFTYGYPQEGERLHPQRLRRIDSIHTTSELLSLATSVYPMFASNSDHRTEGTILRIYCPETILQDPEAMEELETSLKSITSLVTSGGKMYGAASNRRRSIIKGNTKTKSSWLNFKLYSS